MSENYHADIKSHMKHWDKCQKCPIASWTMQKIYYRGNIPADLFLLGEAPGKNENVSGKPFVGSAGRLLNSLMEYAFNAALGNPNVAELTACIANVIVCTPFFDSQRDEIGKPTKEYMENCRPQVEGLFNLVKPKLVVLLGKYAEKYLDHWPNVSYCVLQHPAYIKRQGGTGSLEFKRNYLKLAIALKELGSRHAIPPNQGRKRKRKTISQRES